MLLFLAILSLANGVPSCQFPEKWTGQWFQSGKPQPIAVNSSSIGEKSCIQKNGDIYVVFDNLSGEHCFKCLIINDRHENVIQFREVGDCHPELGHMDDMCDATRTDADLFTMFRLNPKPIACPFLGPPFTFTYNRGTQECNNPVSHAEGCTDNSTLLFKYQACPDVSASESNTEELQCLATWKDGRNKYLVGTVKTFGRSSVTYEETFRCFLYETHHQTGKTTYVLAQSGDSTCSALNSVGEGSKQIRLTKGDKEHNRCKYPTWVTKHHDWHTLDHSRSYHFTTGNATLLVKDKSDINKYSGKDNSYSQEEKIVCHNLEPLESLPGKEKVKLVAHITRGCDIGYVCMIFHKRDGNVIELQQSSRKAVIPDEACSHHDPSDSSFTTLITSSMEKKACPLPGRYTVKSHALSSSPRRKRSSIKNKIKRAAEKRTFSEDNEDNECNVSHIQIGCGSAEQSEMVIANSCPSEQLVYTCHDRWEENGVYYTIVSQTSSNDQTQGSGQTFCFSMRWNDPEPKLSGRGGRIEQQEQELWLSRPTREFQTGSKEQWTYILTSQGICEDLTRASAASSSSLSRVSLVLSAGAAIVCRLLSR